MTYKYMERRVFDRLEQSLGGTSATTCWVGFTADPSRVTSCVASSVAASVAVTSISSTGTAILMLSSYQQSMCDEYRV